MTDRDAAVTGEREVALYIARKAEDTLSPTYGLYMKLARALLAEAARADALEKERDLAAEHAKGIATALRESVDTIIWMSGSGDFAPGAEGHDEWVRRRDLLFKALNLLPSTPAEGSGDADS